MKRPVVTALCVLASIAVVGCEEPIERANSDAYAADALDLDAGTPLDGGGASIDGSLGVDAFLAMDASSLPDAAMGPDASWGSCTVAGRMGTCMPTSLCEGTSTPGYCPGPADIQCCTSSDPVGSHTAADIIARLGACVRIGGDYAKDSGGTANIPICQTGSVVWWTADMDIDCDGGRGAACMADPYYQAETAFVDSHGQPLDASTLPYIVIPGESSRFRYTEHGIRGGQVALVIYEGRLAWGIFGDVGPQAIIGEASYAMAEALGIPSSPISGGVGSGVTYLVFTGADARVSRKEDHDEAVRMGGALLDAFMSP